MATLLVTGFGPFRDVAWNPTAAMVGDSTWQASLRGALTTHHPDVELRFSVLPVVRGAILEASRTGPVDAYLAFGVDSKSERTIRIESAARNFCRDELGESVLDEAGPEWRRSALPLSLTADLLRKTVQPFALEVGGDGTCGSYICNETYYRILASTKPGVFVHTPRVGPERQGELQRALLPVTTHLAKVLLDALR